MSKSGVRAMVKSRVYLGEMSVQSGTKGKPRVVVDAHPPILTQEQWEAAQFSGEFVAPTGKASSAALRGLVYCGGCGKRMRTGTSHRRANGETPVTYTCVEGGCRARAAMLARLLDEHVEGLVQDAALRRSRTSWP